MLSNLVPGMGRTALSRRRGARLAVWCFNLQIRYSKNRKRELKKRLPPTTCMYVCMYIQHHLGTFTARKRFYDKIKHCHISRERKTPVARQHCYPEIFEQSGIFFLCNKIKKIIIFLYMMKNFQTFADNFQQIENCLRHLIKKIILSFFKKKKIQFYAGNFRTSAENFQ